MNSTNSRRSPQGGRTPEELNQIDHADDYIDFLNEAVTPFHAVAELKRAGAAGFKSVNLYHDWSVRRGLLIESADGR